jgi:hypothetical protein
VEIQIRHTGPDIASGHRILHKPITGEELHEAIVAACVDGRESINRGC